MMCDVPVNSTGGRDGGVRRTSHCIMKTIQVDVLMPLPEGWGVCLPCELLMDQAIAGKEPSERGLDEYPADWLVRFRTFCGMMFDLSARYGNTVLFRIFDPRSLPGLIKAIRYGAHHYPAFLVGHQMKIVGFDQEPLQKALEATGAQVQIEPVPTSMHESKTSF